MVSRGSVILTIYGSEVIYHLIVFIQTMRNHHAQPVLSSPESSDTAIPSSDSFESSNDVDPNVSLANVELNFLPENISDKQISTESAGSSAQVPTRRYPSRVRKAPERYQPDPS